MKFLLAALLLPLLAQAQSQNGLNSVGAGAFAIPRVDASRIPAVTVTNLTQTTGDIVRNYFIAAGVDLGRPANTPGAGAGPVVAQGFAFGSPLDHLNRQRQQLAVEHARLAQVITQKRRASKAVGKEATELFALTAALEQMDRDIASQKLLASRSNASPVKSALQPALTKNLPTRRN